MNTPGDAGIEYVDDDPDSGGMSAGAQNGGIVDTGAADDDTDYADALSGRKGGTAGDDADDDFVGGGDFEDEEESARVYNLDDL